MRLLSFVWSSLSWLARRLIALRLIHPVSLPVRVISVGNIQAGGAGKTPLVALLANEAAEHGLSVCILTRGYGGSWERDGGVIVPGESKLDVGCCGDEPFLLHELAPKAVIAVGADRLSGFRHASELNRKNFDLVILDDGFQHWRIKKDFEIVAVTSKRRSEVLFRDFDSALKYADLLIWTKGESRPVVGERDVVRVAYKLPLPVAAAKYWLITGVADHAHVRSSAEAAGYIIEHETSFSDHTAYDESTVVNALKRASEAGCRILLTGKDWVKWRQYGVEQTAVTVLEPTLEFKEGKELWDRALLGFYRV
jgi:tetraacyldisaccharide 4'-kinase